VRCAAQRYCALRPVRDSSLVVISQCRSNSLERYPPQIDAPCHFPDQVPMRRYKEITYERAGPVVTLTINRPTVGNTITERLAQELAETCESIYEDDSVLVTVLTGAEDKSFCTGTDSRVSPLGGREGDRPFVAGSVASLNCPVIAAINGDTLDQGLELAMACDIRIAAETAHFGLSISSGVVPCDGGTQRLPRLVGKGKALEMMLAGEIIDAREALRIGLVNRVVSPGELIPVVRDMAQSIASKGPWALRYGKEAINKGIELTLGEGLRLEADLYSLLQTTSDRIEGVKAFIEKRSAQFKGE
jgi:enoyl-CoA hydratase